jgi:chemotaxis protein MotB
MARKKKGGGGHGGGGHGWFVTFADLMGLLVAFFVMLVAFSNTDQKKMNIVAGSMREAFGTQTAMRYSGMVELDGLPTRARLKNVDPNVKPEDTSATPSPDEKSRSNRFGARLDNEGNFALASASLRQAMQDLPEVSEISKHIMFEETKQGLNIEIMDQNGSSMFPEGSKEPFERTRRLVQRLASGLKTLPYRMTIAGHTPRPGSRAAPATDRGISPPTAPMRYARSSRRRACRPRNSSWWPGAPTPSRYSLTIRSWPPTAVSPSR